MPNIEPPDPESKPASDENFLRSWLASRDTPCPLCAYNLRGLTSDRCPECGTQLRLSVSLVEPYLKAWIALITGVLPPAGFGAVIIFAFIYALSKGVFPSWRDMASGPSGGIFMVLHAVASVPISIAAIAGRRRFQRWSRTSQRICAAAAWVAILLSGFYLLSQI